MVVSVSIKELIEEMKKLHRHLASFTASSYVIGDCQILGYLIHVAVRLEALENNNKRAIKGD